MSIQAALNNEAMKFVPKIKQLINKSSDHEANKMLNKTLLEMMNSYKAICEMTKIELEKFQDDLIKIFEYREWI